MGSQRVFEIANAAGTDVKTVLRELKKLGSDITEPTKDLGPDLTQSVRHALGLPPVAPGTRPASASQQVKVQVFARDGADLPQRPSNQESEGQNKVLGEQLKSEREHAIRKMIPGMYDLLAGCNNLPANGVVVVYGNIVLEPRYDLSTSKRERWSPKDRKKNTRKKLLTPLHNLDRHYDNLGYTSPNTFIAIDIPNRRAWVGHSFHWNSDAPQWDAKTFEPLPQSLTELPVELAPETQRFTPEHVLGLMGHLSAAQDSPEEVFLLHEELVRFAVDSLHSDDQPDPVPVHLNSLWVFARPVVMRQPDNSETWVRAIWYRQGDVLWRTRVFAAAAGEEPEEVGERLVGYLPFVPVWDGNHLEQKILAAIWSLMAQGGITESNRQGLGDGASAPNSEPSALTIVRIKAGTDHAQVYRSDDPSNFIDRPAWSVRGHWRHQPYPSLGRDEDGRIRTKMKWIASYEKGDLHSGEPTDKVIVVRL